jgi:hypothetical protein
MNRPGGLHGPPIFPKIPYRTPGRPGWTAAPKMLQTYDIQKPGASMALIGLREAAQRTGRNKSTIHVAMKTGKLPFTLSAKGTRQIDTRDLAHVFPADDAAHIITRVRRLPREKLRELAKLIDDLEQGRRATETPPAFHSRSFL